MSNEEREYEEGAAGTNKNRKEDPLTQYREKEPMTPAKIREHEPTAVKRTGSDEDEQVPESTEEAKERARRSGMTKGTAGAAPTGNEYEQGAAGTKE